ncbi:MAG: 50S ribosomal protein L25 [Candidatus Pacebacteria bacterium]|nr:50S ribosomal protein L25 [Candidatus Paceibacterota bacterium]
METLVISAQTRELRGRKVNKLRTEGLVPGVVYGYKKETQSISIDSKDFKKVLRSAGENTLINLKIGDKEQGKVIIHEYQADPVTDLITHVDLYQVRMDKKITANVPIKFIGESFAVKNDGAVLVKSYDVLEIKCLPGNLIHFIEVDLSLLDKIDDNVKVGDLKVGEDIEIVVNSEITIVSASAPRTAQEMEDLEEKVEEKVDDVDDGKEKVEEGEKKVEDEKTEIKK